MIADTPAIAQPGLPLPAGVPPGGVEPGPHRWPPAVPATKAVTAVASPGARAPGIR